MNKGTKYGMNPKTLQYIMNHVDIGVILNTYAHISADDVQKEMLKLCVNA
jgi:integrase